MKDINYDRRSINTCFQQRFSLPTYQREYKWEPKHLSELINDLQETFLSHYEEGHGRKEIAAYGYYFLGTIITTEGGNGSKTIIDGQQRLTTILVLLIYFYRISKNNPKLQISDVKSIIKRDVFGESEYNIAFDESRKKMFDVLMNHEIKDEDLAEKIGSIPDLDLSSKQILEIYLSIENFIDPRIIGSLLPHFVDYFTERVRLFEIVVPSEQDAHKVFVTMNDRGLKLGPIDLLKGQLLSRVLDNNANQACHSIWVDCIRKLKTIDPDEDSAFFKSWLRSKYANSSRGKKKGDAPGDFEEIGEAYHRWVIGNKTKLGLEDSDDYYNFISSTIPRFVEIYQKLKVAESRYSPQFPHVFYNGVRGLTLQTMVILAAIKESDTNVEVDKKIKGISFFIDYFSSTRALNGKDNTYDNVRDPLFLYATSIRNKPYTEIRDLLLGEMKGITDKVDAIEQIRYGDLKRQELLITLARIADYVETCLEQTDSVGFSGYVDRTRGNKTFDIEHLVPFTPDALRSLLGDKNPLSSQQFLFIRHSLGCLILLPRGRNRSLQAKPYTEKVGAYATENILAKTLSPSFYVSNPQWERFASEKEIELSPVENFSVEAMEKRIKFYKRISSLIWNPELIRSIMA